MGYVYLHEVTPVIDLGLAPLRSVHHFTSPAPVCGDNDSAAENHARFDAIRHHLSHPACFRQGQTVG